MRRWLMLLLVLIVLLPGNVPSALADPPALEVALNFQNIKQGGVGVIRVSASGLAGARARFLNRLIDFYSRDDAWYGLLATSMEQPPGAYPLEIMAWFEDNTRQTWEGQVTIADGGFIRQDVTIPGELGYLLDPEIDRAERTRLMGLFGQVTPEHYWDGPFIAPAAGEFTSPFGAWRLYNESLWARHTGLDIRGPVGTALVASGAGRVVLAEWLDVRGNAVYIDHGLGIYTGYAHLTEIHVTRGQIVRQGQIIGISGNTGRSSGPHIHWEVAVAGEWVDPAQFLEVTLP